ncbi:MAG TPA: VOC family protein [Rhizomicrobium sp.]|jgi:catechol 2,3-dioxygenase-like lactoylglutathione lyase family enzyme|nr:VOC family protein [Rhizomicrobium sp.]
MLHHVSVGVTDLARAASFYDSVLKALGYRRVADYSPHAIAYGETKDKPEFWIGMPHNQHPQTAGNGTHIGFVAKSKGAVQKFHAAALNAGGSNNGEPGPRPDYGPSYYGAFIYDLDGNKIEATYLAMTLPAKAAKNPAKKAARKAKPAKKKAKKKAKRR